MLADKKRGDETIFFWVLFISVLLPPSGPLLILQVLSGRCRLHWSSEEKSKRIVIITRHNFQYPPPGISTERSDGVSSALTDLSIGYSFRTPTRQILQLNPYQHAHPCTPMHTTRHTSTIEPLVSNSTRSLWISSTNNIFICFNENVEIKFFCLNAS